MRPVAIALVCLAACLPEPDVGLLHPGASADAGTDSQPVAECDNSDSNPEVSVSFSKDLRPLMTRYPGGCWPCHLGRTTAGLEVSSYALLRRGGINTGTTIIIAHDPCNSILLKKFSRTPPFGSRMPLSQPYYTNEQQLLFRDWIAEGALNN